MLFAAWQLKTEVGVADVLSLLTLVFTALGLWYANREIRRGVRDQRAQFLLELTERYFADNAVRKFYYDLENGKFSFDPSNLKKFEGTNEERCLDHLLYTFDVIGQVVRTESLTISEAQIFAFQASQVLKHPEVIKYLTWLDGYYAKQGLPVPAHEAAKFLVETLKSGTERKSQDRAAM